MKEPYQRSHITFRCAPCRHSWKCEPERVEDAPDEPYHPWRYYARCPQCHEEVPQAAWERALLRGWMKATGPKTDEGKKKAAANLAGHPNASARLRTRFNGMKHGLNAKVATFYPAKPNGYPHCRTCRWLNNGCGDWEHGACLTRMELFLQHRIAFQTRNPAMLSELQADLQANTQALINDMILAIVNSGVEIRQPQWYTDKEGGLHIAQYEDENGVVRTIDDLQANPLLKPLYELISRNTAVLSALGMTEKAKEEDAVLQGFLEQKEQKAEDLNGFAERQAQALEQLTTLIERGRNRQQRDPILIEHQQGDGE